MFARSSPTGKLPKTAQSNEKQIDPESILLLDGPSAAQALEAYDYCEVDPLDKTFLPKGTCPDGKELVTNDFAWGLELVEEANTLLSLQELRDGAKPHRAFFKVFSLPDGWTCESVITEILPQYFDIKQAVLQRVTANDHTYGFFATDHCTGNIHIRAGSNNIVIDMYDSNEWGEYLSKAYGSYNADAVYDGYKL